MLQRQRLHLGRMCAPPFTHAPPALGQTEEGLARLRGPIGIYIGSKTPPEIAVSIMAEVLAVKNGVALPRDLDVAYVKDMQGIALSDAGAPVCSLS